MIIIEVPHQRPARGWTARSKRDLLNAVPDCASIYTRAEAQKVISNDPEGWSDLADALAKWPDAQAFVDTNTDAGGGWSHAESEEDAAIEAIGHDLHSLRTFDSADDVREFLAANEKVTGQQKFHQDINVCIEMRKQAEALGWLATVGN